MTSHENIKFFETKLLIANEDILNILNMDNHMIHSVCAIVNIVLTLERKKDVS